MSNATSRSARDPQRGTLSRGQRPHRGARGTRPWPGAGRGLPLLCECARTECSSPIEVDPETFDRVRENPLRFLVAPGHEQLELETVIEQRPGYLIVEKHMT